MPVPRREHGCRAFVDGKVSARRSLTAPESWVLVREKPAVAATEFSARAVGRCRSPGLMAVTSMKVGIGPSPVGIPTALPRDARRYTDN